MVVTSRTIYDFSLDEKEANLLHMFATRCLEMAHGNTESNFTMEAKEISLMGKIMFGIEQAKKIINT